MTMQPMHGVYGSLVAVPPRRIQIPRDIPAGTPSVTTPQHAVIQQQSPDTGQEGRFSGRRYDRWVQIATEQFARYVQIGVAVLLEDGYPPGQEPLGIEDQRAQLTAWKLAGDPRYWNNSRAQSALAKFEAAAHQSGSLLNPPMPQ